MFRFLALLIKLSICHILQYLIHHCIQTLPSFPPRLYKLRAPQYKILHFPQYKPQQLTDSGEWISEGPTPLGLVHGHDYDQNADY